jgi:aminoglycoside-2''-adenylyltransferase
VATELTPIPDSAPGEERVDVSELDFEAFQRIYGAIRPLSPAEAADLFASAPFRWWVAGGWSTELERLPRRFHEDIEIAVPRRDLPTLRRWLRDYHLWDTFRGGMHHLADGEELAEDRDQLWLRRDAYSPWLADLMLTPVVAETWLYKRDSRVARPLDAIIRVGQDGVPYQRPEVSLLFKARRRWQKDELDFEAVLPTLTAADRSWLLDAITLTEPVGHPWLERLA